MGKHFGFSGSTIVAGGGKTLCGLILGLIVCTEDVGAATYYISPTGSDDAAGTSTSVPWKTWSKALGASTSCGDTLLVMDGTFTTATHNNALLTKVCTASTVFTIRAINQRVPLLSNSGAVRGTYSVGLKILDSAYITVDGLRVKSADNIAGDNTSQPMYVIGSNNIIVKNMLLYENNRYYNDQIFNISSSSYVLVEDVEIYKFHRHAFSIGSSSHHVTLRRAYCNSRSWADISGGYASGSTGQGESCVAIYPGNDNTLENVIAENSLSITEINASSSGQGRRNQVLGSIALGTRVNATTVAYGILLDNRGTTTSFQVQDTTVRDTLFLNVGGASSFGGYGIDADGTLNTQIFNSTAINTLLYGFYASSASASQSGGGLYSYFCTNCLAIGNDNTGFLTTDQDTWAIKNSNAFNNGTDYNPSSHANYNPSDTPSAINPQMSNCYLWLPDASPLKGAGLGGADIGATILYRYKNGVLTNVPLWNPTTGEFPHGALVAGVNDVAGQSLFDVHKRLNVNTNGCSFPANYGNGVTDVDAPNTPGGLRIF